MKQNTYVGQKNMLSDSCAYRNKEPNASLNLVGTVTTCHMSFSCDDVRISLTVLILCGWTFGKVLSSVIVMVSVSMVVCWLSNGWCDDCAYTIGVLHLQWTVDVDFTFIRNRLKIIRMHILNHEPIDYMAFTWHIIYDTLGFDVCFDNFFRFHSSNIRVDNKEIFFIKITTIFIHSVNSFSRLLSLSVYRIIYAQNSRLWNYFQADNHLRSSLYGTINSIDNRIDLMIFHLCSGCSLSTLCRPPDSYKYLDAVSRFLYLYLKKITQKVSTTWWYHSLNDLTIGSTIIKQKKDNAVKVFRFFF